MDKILEQVGFIVGYFSHMSLKKKKLTIRAATISQLMDLLIDRKSIGNYFDSRLIILIIFENRNAENSPVRAPQI